MAGIRILVVDDEHDVTDNLSRFIARKFACEVEKAYNGSDALEKIKASPFDLVIMDIKMPGLSGIDVIKEAIKFSPGMKILAVSAYDSPEVANEALKAGAIDYIHKPQPIETLETRIRQALVSGAK